MVNNKNLMNRISADKIGLTRIAGAGLNLWKVDKDLFVFKSLRDDSNNHCPKIGIAFPGLIFQQPQLNTLLL